jgi:hypothetical protein
MVETSKVYLRSLPVSPSQFPKYISFQDEKPSSFQKENCATLINKNRSNSGLKH